MAKKHRSTGAKPASRRPPKGRPGGRTPKPSGKGIAYGVLKGVLIGSRREDADPNSPHYSLKLEIPEDESGRTWSVPVNVQSTDKSEVLFLSDMDLGRQSSSSVAAGWKKKFAALDKLEWGWTALPEHTPGVALDYVREKLFTKAEMTHLPASGPGANDDVQDAVELAVQRAMQQKATVYVFGAKFSNGGVHDIHMNQGNSGNWKKDNGIYQDGGVLMAFPSGRNTGLFFAFQTQDWDTDEAGNPR